MKPKNTKTITLDPTALAQILGRKVSSVVTYGLKIFDATPYQLLETFEDTPISSNDNTTEHLHITQIPEFLTAFVSKRRNMYSDDFPPKNHSYRYFIKYHWAPIVALMSLTHLDNLAEAGTTLTDTYDTRYSTGIVNFSCDPTFLIKFYRWVTENQNMLLQKLRNSNTAEAKAEGQSNTLSTSSTTTMMQQDQASYWKNHVCDFSYADFTRTQPSEIPDTKFLFSKNGPHAFLFRDCLYDHTTVENFFAELREREDPSNNKKTLYFHNTTITRQFIDMFADLLKVSHRCHIAFTGELCFRQYDDYDTVGEFSQLFSCKHYDPRQANLASLSFTQPKKEEEQARIQRVLTDIVLFNPMMNELSLIDKEKHTTDEQFWLELVSAHRQFGHNITELTNPALDKISKPDLDAMPLITKGLTRLRDYLAGESHRFPTQAFTDVISLISESSRQTGQHNQSDTHNPFLNPVFGITTPPADMYSKAFDAVNTQTTQKSEYFWINIFTRLAQELQPNPSMDLDEFNAYYDHIYHACTTLIRYSLIMDLLHKNKLPMRQFHALTSRPDEMSSTEFNALNKMLNPDNEFTLTQLQSLAEKLHSSSKSDPKHPADTLHTKLLPSLIDKLYWLPKEYHYEKIKNICSELPLPVKQGGCNVFMSIWNTPTYHLRFSNAAKVALGDLFSRQFCLDKSTSWPKEISPQLREMYDFEVELSKKISSNEMLKWGEIKGFRQSYDNKIGQVVDLGFFNVPWGVNANKFTYIQAYLKLILALQLGHHQESKEAWRYVYDIIKLYNTFQAPLVGLLNNYLKVIIEKQKTTNTALQQDLTNKKAAVTHANSKINEAKYKSFKRNRWGDLKPDYETRAQYAKLLPSLQNAVDDANKALEVSRQETSRLNNIVQNIKEQPVQLDGIAQSSPCTLDIYMASFNSTQVVIHAPGLKKKHTIGWQALVQQILAFKKIISNIAGEHQLAELNRLHIEFTIECFETLKQALNKLGEHELIQVLELEKHITTLKTELEQTSELTDASESAVAQSSTETASDNTQAVTDSNPVVAEAQAAQCSSVVVNKADPAAGSADSGFFARVTGGKSHAESASVKPSTPRIR